LLLGDLLGGNSKVMRLPSRNTLRAKPKPKRSGEATLDAAASALLARFAPSRANKSIPRARKREREKNDSERRGREAEILLD